MAKKSTGSESSALNLTAETIGAALGSVAARLDTWKKQRAELAADIQNILHSATGLLGDLGHAPGSTPPADVNGAKSRKGGRPKGYVMSDETKAKLRAAWKKRRGVASDEKEHTKPGDVRATVRATSGKKFTARQRGRG